jgi:predicted nucleotide-binding protein
LNWRAGVARSKGAGPAKQTKPELFIASSAESLELTTQLQTALSYYFTAKPWTAGAVRPSRSPLQGLETELGRAKFAVFVFAKDDTVISRGKQSEAVRDNVLLELGMFIGRLGSERCFVVAPKNRAKLKIPSDLDGFTPIIYDDELFEREPQTAVAPVVTQIRNAIRELPPPSAVDARAEVAAEPDVQETTPDALASALSDLLEVFAGGRAGLKIEVTDKAALQVWAQVALKNTLHVLRGVGGRLPGDAYVAWLRPAGRGQARNLSVFAAENLLTGYSHYQFSPNEGLAGTVWAGGQAGRRGLTRGGNRTRPGRSDRVATTRHTSVCPSALRARAAACYRSGRTPASASHRRTSPC